MQIQIDLHTLQRAKERGTNESEIRDIIKTGFPVEAKYGNKGKAKIYDFNQKRLGEYYRQKRVEVIYTIEDNNIITITVYVFYGKWEDINGNNL
jgi:hypothetical protein